MKKSKNLFHFSLSAVKVFYLCSFLAFAAIVAAYIYHRNSASTSPPIYYPVIQSPTFTPSASPKDYAVDVNGRIELKEFGLTILLDPELSAQKLVGTPGFDPSYPASKSISFSTRELAKENIACTNNGARGWIGTLTRYEGSSDAMTDHSNHTTVILNYPGFHTSYRSVTQLCPERKLNSTSVDLSKEKTAAGYLWQAVRDAELIPAP